jgi:hypothetical protein
MDENQKELLRLTLRCTRLEDEIRQSRITHDEENTEVRSKALSQLTALRSQFESDRLELKQAIDKLQKEKIDLQSEIGQLLRDRRGLYPRRDAK